uniref:N-acetylneuraminate lyase n=1 Tax=Podarcis muralis TaxID=64176 RepID=A0A670HQG6_PODMU
MPWPLLFNLHSLIVFCGSVEKPQNVALGANSPSCGSLLPFEKERNQLCSPCEWWLNKNSSDQEAYIAHEVCSSKLPRFSIAFLVFSYLDALVAFLRDVASEAPGIPFYYYHIPPLTGIKITAYELLNGMIEQIPTFKGVKFSDKDLLDFGQCVKKNDRGQFVLLYGVDEVSTYNYLGKANNSMLEAFANGDLSLSGAETLSLWNDLCPFFFWLGFGVAETKAIVTLLSGIPMGPPRLPLSSASEEFIASVKPKLESLKNCCYS